MAEFEAGAAQDVEAALLQYLEAGPCTLDDLARQLPRYTWNQIFAAVDRLSRRGELQIRHVRRFEYAASLAGAAPNASRSGAFHLSRDVEKGSAAQGNSH